MRHRIGADGAVEREYTSANVIARAAHHPMKEMKVPRPGCSEMAMSRVVNMIVLGENDNVGVALRDIEAGDMACDANSREVIAREAIPQAHKLALAAIKEGEPVIRMGVPVGIARAAIAKGALAHIHNVRSQYLDNAEDHYE
jgi:hypothetical protein